MRPVTQLDGNTFQVSPRLCVPRRLLVESVGISHGDLGGRFGRMGHGPQAAKVILAGSPADSQRRNPGRDSRDDNQTWSGEKGRTGAAAWVDLVVQSFTVNQGDGVVCAIGKFDRHAVKV